MLLIKVKKQLIALREHIIQVLCPEFIIFWNNISQLSSQQIDKKEGLKLQITVSAMNNYAKAMRNN